MKLLCYGDSNTYGYDPRGPIPGRYGADCRWCDLLAKKTSWTVINEGENGRMVPEPAWGYTDLKRVLAENAPVDAMLIMLGSNDIPYCGRASIKPVVERMEALLDFLREHWPDMRLNLLTPPPVDVPEFPDMVKKLSDLASAYRVIAEKRKIDFIDVSIWDVPLAYDGVHLSQRGQQIFAQKLIPELETILSGIY